MTALGRVESMKAHIWMRTEHPGRFILQWWSAEDSGKRYDMSVEIPEYNERDNTSCVQIPQAEEPALQPLTRYFYQVSDEASGTLLGQGTFETAPKDENQTPERFSVAVMSCNNQPFDARGRVLPASAQMLKAAR